VVYVVITQITKTHEGKFLPVSIDETAGFWTGTIPSLVEEVEPRLSWTGPKIPEALLREIYAFLQWCFKKHGGEGQVRLFLKDNLWEAEALPQFASSTLFTEEIKDSPERDAILSARTQDGWIMAGSVHSHCTASAFQSGIDKADECNIPGIHITVGNMNQPVWSTHARCYFRKLFVEAKLDEWIAPSEGTFPEPRADWVSRVKEKPKPLPTPAPSYLQMGCGYEHWHKNQSTWFYTPSNGDNDAFWDKPSEEEEEKGTYVKTSNTYMIFLPTYREKRLVDMLENIIYGNKEELLRGMVELNQEVLEDLCMFYRTTATDTPEPVGFSLDKNDITALLRYLYKKATKPYN
jgi:hypothetical protein